MTSTGAALGMGRGETHAAANTSKAETGKAKGTAEGFPVGRIGPLRVSRLICGGNLISGWAHSRDLRYMPSLFRNYFTDEKVMETFALCEERGINTFLSDPREKPMRIIKRYWDERGGKMQWFAEGHPKVKDIKTNLQLSIDHGASAIYIQGGVADNWVKHGRIDLLGKAVDFIKQNGLVAGIGGHAIQVPQAVEKAGIEVDFYMKTLHRDDYWSASPKAERPEFGLPQHDNMWSTRPDETIAFMKTVKKPWIAFKVLAAGAIHPRIGFKYAFENGADFICVGMCDFQVLEDVMIARGILKDQALPQVRQRPWRA